MRRLRARAVRLCVCVLAAAGCAAADSVSLHPASAMVRIGGVDGLLPPAASDYHLLLARNEREGFQFAIVPAGDVAIRVHAVTVETPEGAPAATLYRVLAVNHVAPPTNSVFVVPPRRLGLIPDVLMPMDHRLPEAVAAPATHVAAVPPLTYYVEFSATPETRPAIYPCRVCVVSQAGTNLLHVAVRVARATLPMRFPFRAATCWNWSLQAYYSRPLAAEEKSIFWRFCLDQRISPCAFFDRQPDPAPADLPDLQGRGLSLVCLLQVSGRRPRLLSDNDKARYAPLLHEWRATLQHLGLEHDAVVLLTDEPEEGAAEVCRQNAAWLKAQFPELRMWCATRPEALWSEFGDVFDTVTAHSTELYRRHSHDAAALNAFRMLKPFPAGEYWWFHSVEPYAPYANVRLDNLPVEARVSGWQSAQARVDGYEYFWITDWSGNLENRNVPWPARAAKWQTGLSGAGTLCYPDEARKPMPSLRLVNLRDGLEDWALLELLSPRGTRTSDPLPLQDVTRSLTDFTTDPAVLLKARAAVIEALEPAAAPAGQP